MEHPFRFCYRRIRVNVLSTSDVVCTLKQAARMLVERDFPKALIPDKALLSV
ncbi:hypothetical protein [Rossellomorea marisflavi]